ncbi:MAG: hypothetical protein HRT72_04375, partial [Flavobacteriales bacterium]|nr:hypothetical protein [Flavobacteriales bacterium]
MKKTILLSIFLIVCCSVRLVANKQEEKTNDTKVVCESCKAKSKTYKSNFQLQSSFIPKEDKTPIKTIKVAFHVWQDDAGENNWKPEQDSLHRIRLNKVIESINKKYRKVKKPSHPQIEANKELKDSRLRLVLDRVYVYKNQSLHKSKSINDLNNYVIKNHPSRIDKVFPIHITNAKYGKAAGIGKMPSRN